MAPLIDILIGADIWEECPIDPAEHAEKIAAIALKAGLNAQKAISADIPYEFSILLTDDAAIQELNRNYRNKDKPTNVLSFATLDDPSETVLPGQPFMLGDIAIAYQTMQKEADTEEKDLIDHFNLLIIHGVLHLLGFDHIDDSEAVEMEALEQRILSTLT